METKGGLVTPICPLITAPLRARLSRRKTCEHVQTLAKWCSNNPDGKWTCCEASLSSCCCAGFLLAFPVSRRLWPDPVRVVGQHLWSCASIQPAFDRRPVLALSISPASTVDRPACRHSHGAGAVVISADQARIMSPFSPPNNRRASPDKPHTSLIFTNIADINLSLGGPSPSASSI